MSFSWFTNEQRKLEEDAIFALAGQIRACKKVDGSLVTWERFIDPLLESGGVHSNRRDNFISFGMLGGFLHPEFGSGSHMPQTTLPWLSLRRLFLAVYRTPIPKHLRSGDSEVWKSDFEPHLDRIRRITELRLQSYAGVSLAAMRRLFVEIGEVYVDSACGALFKLHEKTFFDFFPDSRTPPDGRNTTALLRKVVKEAGIDFDFDSEYRKAVDSVRAVIFDIALEAIFDKVPEDSTDLWELEKMSFERSIIEDPCRILSDNNLVLFLAEGMENRGSAFLERLSNRFETAEKDKLRFNVNHLKVALCQYWLQPDFPLWLMSVNVIDTLLGLKFSDASAELEGQINEITKNRTKEPGSALYTSSKKLLKGIHLDSVLGTYRGLDFQGYLKKDCPSFPDLESHVSNLSISDFQFEHMW